MKSLVNFDNIASVVTKLWLGAVLLAGAFGAVDFQLLSGLAPVVGKVATTIAPLGMSAILYNMLLSKKQNFLGA
jgi:hypothetical protein